ncbi:MAG: glycosyltransferase family 4 protein [Muribaculaceae bacterium]|nr:glycosyltransferase family 4 protein [Muribaculaceae bacterium]
MKISHILWGLDYGGIETMVVNIANEQVAAGHDVTVIIINSLVNPELKSRLKPQIKVVELGRKEGSRNPWHIFKLNRAIKKAAADVVHFHNVNIARLVNKGLLKKWCTTHHTTWRPELARFFKGHHKLFAISPEASDDLRNRADVEAQVIVNGIETDRFRKRENADNSTPFRIVQIGRLNLAIKGQDITMEAVKSLVDKGYNVHVDFIGSGDALDTLVKLAKAFGIEKNVTFRGARSQEYIQEHLADYDLLVQPSRIEGFGLTVAEAMAARVPVAVSDLPALVSIVDNGSCGYIFRGDSAVKCAKAIEQAMNGENTAMIDRAEERVHKLYDVRSTAHNYL